MDVDFAEAMDQEYLFLARVAEQAERFTEQWKYTE
jgi:hypothetical protein